MTEFKYEKATEYDGLNFTPSLVPDFENGVPSEDMVIEVTAALNGLEDLKSDAEIYNVLVKVWDDFGHEYAHQAPNLTFMKFRQLYSNTLRVRKDRRVLRGLKTFPKSMPY